MNLDQSVFKYKFKSILSPGVSSFVSINGRHRATHWFPKDG